MDNRVASAQGKATHAEKLQWLHERVQALADENGVLRARVTNIESETGIESPPTTPLAPAARMY